MATKFGMVKKTDLAEFFNIRKTGLAAISLKEGDELIGVWVTDNTKDIFLATKFGQSIRFHETDVRSTGRTSKGVRGIELEDEDEVIGMQLIVPDGKLLFVSELGMGKLTRMEEFSVQYRGGKGMRCYRINEKTGNLIGCLVPAEKKELMIITNQGTIIRIKTDGISTLGRNTFGVKLINIDPESEVRVSGIELVLENEEDETKE